MARSIECEIHEGGKWKGISVGDALEIPRVHRQLRCAEPICHKQVRAHKRGKNGAAAHFEHLKWNAQCPRSAQSLNQSNPEKSKDMTLRMGDTLKYPFPDC